MAKHSKYRGVTWSTHKKRWMAQVRYHGTVRFLGYFDEEIEAALRHDVEVLFHRSSGETLNFPRDVLEEWVRGACAAQKNGPPFQLEGEPSVAQSEAGPVSDSAS